MSVGWLYLGVAGGRVVRASQLTHGLMDLMRSNRYPISLDTRRIDWRSLPKTLIYDTLHALDLTQQAYLHEFHHQHVTKRPEGYRYLVAQAASLR